jgi:hypothetical protein
MILNKKTHCPRPGCAGEFKRTVDHGELVVATDRCSVCDYYKKTILSGPFAGNINYYKDGKRVELQID